MENNCALIEPVAVTAYSALSACGMGSKALYQSLSANQSQLAPLSLFNLTFPSYVGEIKNVQNATVSLKTNAAGLLSIEWRYVVGLKSKYQYRIELTGGTLRYGSLAVAEKPGQMRIVSAVDSVDV